MKTELSKSQVKELKQALKNKENAQHHRKIQALILYSESQNLTAAAKSVGFVHQTVRNLLNRYQEGGLEAILTDKRGGRRRYYLTYEEEKNFLEEQMNSAMDGEFVTISSLHQAYQEKVGQKTTREGFYALLKRHGWRKVSPRPQHPKKADAQSIEASKNKISI